MKRKNKFEALWSGQPRDWKRAYMANLPEKYTLGDGAAAVTEAVRLADSLYAKAKHSGNPLAVWIAYQTFRDAELPLPDWILSYLDRAAAQLHEGITLQPRDSAAYIAQAFLMSRRGRGTVFSSFQDRRSVFAVLTLFSEIGADAKLYAAHAKIAKALGVDKRTARRLVQRFFDERAIELK